MTVAVGIENYNHGSGSCTGSGRTWSADELDAALAGSVSAIVFDEEGMEDLAELFSEVVGTGFAKEGLAHLWDFPDNIESWRIGEAIAQAYLQDHRACTFPWPIGRDERKRGLSLPGADLVGFELNASGNRFAFGEVKTSRQEKYPPGVMCGSTGLEGQLKNLRDQVKIRYDLVKYLGNRAVLATWKERYQEAVKRYLSNGSDVQIFGVLIRDVDPDKKDVRRAVDKLSENCPEGTDIEFLVLYLPKGSIEQLSKKVMATRSGEEE